MEKDKFLKVVNEAARSRACRVVDLQFNDDDNVFELTIDKEDGLVEIGDCEFVHRAVLAAFDRNIEDYALTVGSPVMTPAQADSLLETIED